VYGVAVGLVFACLYVTLVFRGSAFTRISVGAVIGLFWGVTQGAAASHRRQRAAQQQDAATWTPPIASHPMPPRPSTRYRTAVVAEGLAVTGAVVAATNAAALWWPEGGFTFLTVTVTAPSLSHLGWLIVGALTLGFILAGVATVDERRRLTRRPLPPSPADSVQRRPAQLLLGFLAVGLSIAVVQWLGVVAAIGSLAMIMFGFAAALAGIPIALSVARYERRTGQTVVSPSPVGLWPLGLESRPSRR
jgi:hypothetical protein